MIKTTLVMCATSAVVVLNSTGCSANHRDPSTADSARGDATDPAEDRGLSAREMAKAAAAPLTAEVPDAGYRSGAPSAAWQALLKEEGERAGLLAIDPSAGRVIPPIESFFFANPETVCDPDERARIRDTRVRPWDANCRLVITMTDGQVAVGTGWLMGPRLVVTAGHCVHEGEGGRFFKQIEVVPAANGSQSPYGSQVSTRLRASQKWQTSGSLPDDYGAIILDAPFQANGSSPSMHVTHVATDAELGLGDASVSGYPADKASATQWVDSDPFSHIMPTRLRYRLDTYGGQSGSAVIHGGNAVGIHNYGGCPNFSTRITAEVQAQLRVWVDESNR